MTEEINDGEQINEEPLSKEAIAMLHNLKEKDTTGVSRIAIRLIMYLMSLDGLSTRVLSEKLAIHNYHISHSEIGIQINEGRTIFKHLFILMEEINHKIIEKGVFDIELDNIVKGLMIGYGTKPDEVEELYRIYMAEQGLKPRKVKENKVM